MQIGMVGLGRMGANMARRMARKGAVITRAVVTRAVVTRASSPRVVQPATRSEMAKHRQIMPERSRRMTSPVQSPLP